MKKMDDLSLYVGDLQDASAVNDVDWAVVHATQTIHYRLFGWNRTNNKPDKTHPNYIYYEKENRLSLNWVDGAAYLYNWSGVEIFNKMLNFIEKWLPKKKVLIHCDQGYSRSPALCLLYLAKRSNSINNDSYDEARKDFIKIFPKYSPGGIGDYIRENWKDIH